MAFEMLTPNLHTSSTEILEHTTILQIIKIKLHYLIILE